MGPEDAEEYTQALGQVVAGGWRQVALGKRLGVPEALGLTVEEWVEGRLGGYVRLSIPDRREAVVELVEEGLSTRQIGAVLGVDQSTIVRDGKRGDADASGETDELASEPRSAPASDADASLDSDPSRELAANEPPAKLSAAERQAAEAEREQRDAQIEQVLAESAPEAKLRLDDMRVVLLVRKTLAAAADVRTAERRITEAISRADRKMLDDIADGCRLAGDALLRLADAAEAGQTQLRRVK